MDPFERCLSFVHAPGIAHRQGVPLRPASDKVPVHKLRTCRRIA
jgi:hypothetical protein